MAFDVKGWTSVEGDIKITAGSQNQTVSYTATISGSFESKSIDFTIAEAGSMTVKLETTAKRAFLDNIVITNTTSGSSSLDDSDLALVDAPVELEFDLYDNANAQTISYTTSSTGAVTVSQSNYITATVNANNTITVTPVAVTNGPQTITVNQAADNTYAAGSVTFTVDIEDSTPTTGSDVTFDATVDKDLNNTSQGQGSIVKNGVTFTCSDGILGNGTEYRLYKNSTTTFSVESGTITQIVFTCTSGNPASGFSTQTGWTTNGSNGTWTGNATSVSFVASSKQVRATTIVVTVETSSTSDPTISADDVNIAYDAEEGTITYTINNPVEGGSIVASTEAEWLMVDDEAQTDAEGSIDFICAPNSNFYAHSATVTLTYTYGDSKATVTKEVTVTQAKDPNANGSTAEYPITVSEALEAIDEVETVSDIYVGGIVSAIVDEYSSTYHNITFDMIDEDGDEYYLRAYRCVGTDGVNASEVAVGDYVIVKGDLKLYTSSNSSIYELGQGCQLVSLTHPVVPTITLSSYSIEATAEETEGTLTVTYTEIETELDPEIHWFESDGVTTASEPDWMSAEINAQLNVDYLIEENEGAARTAYFKVYLDEELNDVYSDLVTVSQAAAPQQYTLEVTSISNAEIFVFDATDPDESNWVYLFDGVNSEQVTEGTLIALSVSADQGYVLETLMVNNDNVISQLDESGAYTFTMPASNVTISATAVEDVPVTPGTWVLTNLVDLTEDDVFVIVGDNGDTYAMPNDNGASAAPAAVAVTVVEGTLSAEPAANLQWNISITEDGYTFYPNGETETWLYCINNNNGVRVGTGDAKHFTLDEGYLTTTETTDQRYIGIYNSQDWRCYKLGTDGTFPANIANQTFSFYKKVVEPATETHTLTVNAYTNDNTKDGYNLIASPVNVDPATVAGMTTGDFDLYSFDESQADEWRNYEATAFTLVPGKGYLYAKKATTENQTYSFELTGIPYNNEPIILSKSESGDFPGWNLVGNPFGETAVLSDNRDFYVMNSDGSDFIQGSGAIAPMQGIFVIAEEDDEELEITPAGGTAIGPTEDSKLVLNLTKGRGIIDRAVVRFGEGRTLPKFMLNADNTKLYITEGNQDYAVVRSNNAGEMPVSFKAAENGNYTLSIEAENVEASYLHLIDNMTGADINLLATPSYSFEARTTDYANRFRLEFNTNGVEENNATANFAYFNGSSWTVNNMGEATLQVVDMMGRVISTESVSGNTEVNLNQAAGVYMLRLVTGNDVKVQKVVVR